MDGSVAIVGAGIGGLSLALSLHARGVPVTVHEQATELREVGAAVALSANGLRPLAELGLLDELDAVATEPSELIHRGWRTHDRITGFAVGVDGSYRARFGAPYLGIHRAEFQRVLAGACPDGMIRLGSRVESVVDLGDRVELRLAGDEIAHAAVAVGADGVHSRLRQSVAPGSGPVYTGTSGFRGLVPVADVPSLPDPTAIQFWMGPDAHLLHYAIDPDAGRINFLAVLEGPDEWSGGAGPQAVPDGTLAAAFGGWAPAVREMVTAVPQSDRWPLYTLPPLNRWSDGRVVLIGDAAHTMLPHHGQGANQSLEDAAVLADLLVAPEARTGGHAAAFARYERLRRARTRKVQRSSLVTSDLLHLPDGDEAAARDARLAGLDPWLAWIHGVDARESTRALPVG
ncbi:FAD-dependent monooxygenase [Pseudonocardia endophytica]|uniref:Salicylate hydroxylase n=1 Tax=Pseudonocardia endophytica TaxID=401976 RepID=A0A4R1HH35_PSEEN|nr:FAD-dependent monooxygenase [Pseudonocardia endophytica]TCK21507.1 salicylate hydroxylase [Pseudonocardia endophytica]